MPFWKSTLVALALTTPALAADLTAVTSDGHEVLLRDNGTWTYIHLDTDKKGAPLARLTLENKSDLARGCRLGLRLQNDLPEQIRTLVLRFTAYKGEVIAFETVSRGFSYIKPTNSQYQEISFRGIGCDEIRVVEVTAARNCHVGEITKYSASADACLKLVEVEPSKILPIAKKGAK